MLLRYLNFFDSMLLYKSALKSLFGDHSYMGSFVSVLRLFGDNGRLPFYRNTNSFSIHLNYRDDNTGY